MELVMRLEVMEPVMELAMELPRCPLPGAGLGPGAAPEPMADLVERDGVVLSPPPPACRPCSTTNGDGRQRAGLDT